MHLLVMLTIGYSALTTDEFRKLFKVVETIGLEFVAKNNQIIMAIWRLT
jgi:hypothetical protein